MKSAEYNLFLRNWINNRATGEQIQKAIEKGYITQEEAEEIMANPRNQI